MEEVIENVLVKFPEDRGCTGAGQRKKDLDRKGNLSNQPLSIPDGDAIEIGDHHSTHKVGGNIQRWKVYEELQRTRNPIKEKNDDRCPGSFAQGVDDPGNNFFASYK